MNFLPLRLRALQCWPRAWGGLASPSCLKTWHVRTSEGTRFPRLPGRRTGANVQGSQTRAAPTRFWLLRRGLFSAAMCCGPIEAPPRRAPRAQRLRFPQRCAAAPLKPPYFQRLRPILREFSAAMCCGPIEAKQELETGARVLLFSAAMCCGPIEASAQGQAGSRPSCSFPQRCAAAPLKP